MEIISWLDDHDSYALSSQRMLDHRGDHTVARGNYHADVDAVAEVERGHRPPWESRRALTRLPSCLGEPVTRAACVRRSWAALRTAD